MTNNVTREAVSCVEMAADCVPAAAQLRCLSLLILSFLRIWIFMKYPQFLSFLETRETYTLLPHKQENLKLGSGYKSSALLRIL